MEPWLVRVLLELTWAAGVAPEAGWRAAPEAMITSSALVPLPVAVATGVVRVPVTVVAAIACAARQSGARATAAASVLRIDRLRMNSAVSGWEAVPPHVLNTARWIAPASDV